MKRTTILLVLLFTFTCVFAQKGKVTSAKNYKDQGNLEKAVAAIEEAINPNNPKAESSINWSGTWEARGEIYQAIAKSKDENITKLSSDPLTTAFDSYMKAIELDEKGKLASSIKVSLTLLRSDLTNQAVDAFNGQNYDKALKSFEQVLAIDNVPVIKADDPAFVDTVIIYNAGLAAYNSKNYDKAIQLYREAAKYKYMGADMHRIIASTYKQKQDTIGALEALEAGLKEYPGNGVLLVEIINIHLNANNSEKALEYLNLALKQDPNNPSYHFAIGSLYEKIKKPEEALASYLKAIELKEDFFDPYYNLGVFYYNRGVKQIDIANAVPTNQPAKYDEEKNKADDEFRKALPYMEKAHSIDPSDKPTMESLKTLYYRLNMLDKHAAILEKMKNL